MDVNDLLNKLNNCEYLTEREYVAIISLGTVDFLENSIDKEEAMFLLLGSYLAFSKCILADNKGNYIKNACFQLLFALNSHEDYVNETEQDYLKVSNNLNKEVITNYIKQLKEMKRHKNLINNLFGTIQETVCLNKYGENVKEVSDRISAITRSEIKIKSLRENYLQ